MARRASGGDGEHRGEVHKRCEAEHILCADRIDEPANRGKCHQRGLPAKRVPRDCHRQFSARDKARIERVRGGGRKRRGAADHGSSDKNRRQSLRGWHEHTRHPSERHQGANALTRQQNAALAKPVGRLPANKREQEHRNKLRQPHQPEHKSCFGHRARFQRQQIDLRANHDDLHLAGARFQRNHSPIMPVRAIAENRHIGG